MGSVNLREGLVGEWNIEGGLADTSGNGYVLTAGGTPTLTTDRLNRPDRAYSLDGTSDYLYTGDMTSDFSNEATLVMWVKLDVATPASADQTGLCGMSSLNDTTHYPFTNGLGYFKVFLNTRKDSVTLSSNVTRTEWHMLTFTTTPGASGWKFYQNKELITTSTGESTVPIPTSCFIGHDNSSSRWLDGEVGVCKMWNRALGTEEIAQVYNEIKPHYQPLFKGCVSYYDMNGDANDLIGNNDGTVVNSTLTTGRLGISDTAYNYDGTGDWITVDDLAVEAASDTIGTVIWWAKADDVTPSQTKTAWGFGNESANHYMNSVLRIDGDIRCTFAINGTQQWQIQTSSPGMTSTSEWYQLALVQDGVEPVLYINGVEPSFVFNTSTDKTAWLTDFSASADRGRIGNLRRNSTNGNPWVGDLGEFYYFNTDLSAAQIKENYDLTKNKYITPFSQGGKK